MPEEKKVTPLESVLKVKKKKPRRQILVPFMSLLTLTVVVVCTVMVLNIFKESGNPLFGAAGLLELPNFVGMSEKEAEELLGTSPYNDLTKEYVYEYEEDPKTVGRVIAQRPSPKTVKGSQKVVLVVNQGAQDVEVPNVNGKSRTEAKKSISEAGLVPYIKTVYDRGGIPLGQVLNTEPAAGKTVKNVPGENIVVVNIAGQRIGGTMITVPSFTGLPSLGTAQTLASNYHLELSVVREESEEAAGTILGQWPAAGTAVQAYSTVRVTVAVGPQEEPPAEE